MIIANPDGTYTALRADGNIGQFNSPDEALSFAGGQDTPDTTESDAESVEVGLINPATPSLLTFARTDDDAALVHQPTGKHHHRRSRCRPSLRRPRRGRRGGHLLGGDDQGRFESLDEAIDALEADAEDDQKGVSGQTGLGGPPQSVLSTHPFRDFSVDKKGKPAVDKKTGKPLTPRTGPCPGAALLRGSSRARSRSAPGTSTPSSASTSIKAKVISGDREGFELDPSETDLFATLATQIQQSNVPQSTKDRLAELTDPAALAGKRMFVDSKGGAIVAVDPADGRMHRPVHRQQRRPEGQPRRRCRAADPQGGPWWRSLRLHRR